MVTVFLGGDFSLVGLAQKKSSKHALGVVEFEPSHFFM